MYVKTYSAVVNGLNVTRVTIEVSVVPGIAFHFTGLGDEAVREGRDRVAANAVAIQRPALPTC